jgi:hypothetical protein
MGCKLNISIGYRVQAEDDISRFYHNLDSYIQENTGRIEDDIKWFEDSAAQQGLVYAGKPLSISFYPIILPKMHVAHIKEVVETLTRLMEKITCMFLEEPDIRQIFGFSREQTELIEIDPGYESAIPCGRFDSFFDGRTIRFTEFNTDGTAGMDGAEKIAKLYLSAPSMQDFFSAYTLQAFDIHHCVLSTLLDCYGQYMSARPVEGPCIAIVDWKEARTKAEFVAFAEFCRAQGYEAIIADPRELEYDGGTLSHQGQKIDIIYRRVVSAEYMDRLEEVKPMTRAFRDHNVCLVGSFRSDVAFSKKAFGLLHMPELAHFFSADERRVVERHIPWTQPFEDIECEYLGHNIGMPDVARQNKDAFVLKPSNLYEGQGVWLGSYKEQDEWEKLIEAALKEDYVLQELVPIPYMPVGTWDDKFEKKERFVHLGEYVFGGTFCGLYCRVAEGPLIDRTSRERLAPCLVLET